MTGAHSLVQRISRYHGKPLTPCSGVCIEMASYQVVHATVGAKFLLIDARVFQIKVTSICFCLSGVFPW